MHEFGTSQWRLAASISFALLQYLVFACQAAVWYTAVMQLFTHWIWTDASRLNQSKLIYVYAVIVKALECNVSKKTNFFCNVIKKWWSSTCNPRKFRQASQGIHIFFKPWSCDQCDQSCSASGNEKWKTSLLTQKKLISRAPTVSCLNRPTEEKQ